MKVLNYVTNSKKSNQDVESELI